MATTKQPEVAPEWLTSSEAAAAMGCSEQTLRRRAAAGLITPHPRAGRLFFRRADVENLLAKRNEPPRRIAAAKG